MSASFAAKARAAIAPVINKIPRGLRDFVLIVTVLTVALLATYQYVVFSGDPNRAGRYDIYRAQGPLSYFMDYMIQREGQYPYWNPLTFMGMPYAANPVSVGLYPPNLVRSLLTTSPTPVNTQIGWAALMGFHILLAGVGITYLAKDHKLSLLASLLAAIIFMFSAIWVRRVCEYHFITMVAWVPWLLLIARHTLRSPSVLTKVISGTACSLIVGNALLSGAINIAPYFGLSVGMYALLYRITLIERPLQFSARGIVRVLSGDALFIGLMFGLGGMLASPLLLAGSELSSFGSRGGSGEYTFLPPVYKGTLHELFQNFIRYPGLKYESEAIRGAGIGAIVLAIAGLGFTRWKELLPALGVLLVLFDCAMGVPWPMATLVYKITPMEMVSSNRALDFGLILFGLVAAMGFDTVTRALTRRSALPWLLALAAGGFCLYSLWPLMEPKGFLEVTPLKGVGIPALTLAAVALAGWLPGKPLWRVAIVALIFAETLVWSRPYVHWLIYRENFPKWAGTFDGDATLWADNVRGTDPLSNRHLYALRGVMNGYEPAHIGRVRDVAGSEARLKGYRRLINPDEPTEANVRGNLLLKRAFWLSSQYVVGPLPKRSVPFISTTTTFLDAAQEISIPRVEVAEVQNKMHSGDVERRTLTHEDGSPFHVNAKGGAKKQSFELPPIEFTGRHNTVSVQYVAPGNATLRIRFTDPASGNWVHGMTQRLRKTAKEGATVEIALPDYAITETSLTLETTASASAVRFNQFDILADKRDENALITIKKRLANSVAVTLTNLPGPRLLTFMDAMYPGWKATVDGKETPIYLANEAFKAIAVPPGTHEVVFSYHPARLFLGFRIAGATLIIIVGTLGYGVWRDTKSRKGKPLLNQRDQ
jgi:hypothetical protein